MFGLAAVLVLVGANGFFVATEFAIVAVRRSRLAQLAAEGNTTARVASDIVGHLDAYIAACQLGITMASLALGWIGEPALAHLLQPPLQLLVGRFAPQAAHGVAVAVAFLLITGLHIVVGELAPKGLALQRTDGTVLWVARPIRAFYLVFRWPITALNAVGNAALRLVGLPTAASHEQVHTPQELRYLVAGTQRAGGLEPAEARIASRALAFAQQTVGSLLTPRTRVHAIPLAISREELLARVAATRHSRLPVYRTSLDEVAGVLDVHDLFAVLARPPAGFDLAGLLGPVLAVPESMAADDLLERMQAEGHQLAVVIDEYGSTAGIVTIGDLLQALVGPIQDEPTLATATPERADNGRAADGSLLLDGLTDLTEFQERTGLEISSADQHLAKTLGGLVMAHLGRVPAPGDQISLHGHTLCVEAMEGRRVATVRLLPPDPTTKPDR
jgi:putative hemolysin